MYHINTLDTLKLIQCGGLVAKSCLTLGDPMDCSLPGSSVNRISQQEYWSGLPFPPPGNIPDPGIEPASLTLQVVSLPLSHQGSPLFVFTNPQLKFSFLFIIMVDNKLQ